LLIFLVNKGLWFNILRMPCSLRIQYVGARYHVINRGNYRGDILETDGVSDAFLKALAETLHRYATQKGSGPGIVDLK
jgi:REP element-mobilizing transposase RayT